MYKKALSLLLSLMLIVTSLGVTAISVAAAGNDGFVAEGAGDSVLTVTATSNYFPTDTQAYTQAELDEKNGLVTVTYYMKSDEMLLNTDWLLTYDGTVLAYSDENNTNVMPCATGAMINPNPKSVEYGVKGNYTDLALSPLCTENGEKVAFVTVTFKVIGSGDTNVNLNLENLRVSHLNPGETLTSDENETLVIDDSTVLADAPVVRETVVSAGIPGDEPEEPTEEPTTEPVPLEGLKVTSTSNFFGTDSVYASELKEDENGDLYVTVKYLVYAPGKYIVNCDIAELTYDPAVLEWNADYNKTESGMLNFFPASVEQALDEGVVNMPDMPGRLVGNFSSVDNAIYAYGEDETPITVVQATFKVLDKDAVETVVNCVVEVMAFCDEGTDPSIQDVAVFDCVVNEEVRKAVNPQTVIDPHKPVTPGEQPTEEPTEEPTTDVAAKELVVNAASNYAVPAEATTTVKAGDKVTVAFKLPADFDIISTQWKAIFDAEMLQYNSVATFTGDMLLNEEQAADGNVMGSVSNIDTPYAVTTADDYVVLTFTALKDGETDVYLDVVDLLVKDGDNEKLVVIDSVVQVGELDVNATSNYAVADPATTTVKAGDTVTISFKLPEDFDIISTQWKAIFNAEMLQYDGVVTFTEDMMLNTEKAAEGKVMGSVSNIETPYSVASTDGYVVLTFTALQDGETEVYLDVVDLLVKDGDTEKLVVVDSIVQTDEPEEPTTEPTEAPTEEPTEAPTEEPTEAPTEEPTEAPTEEPTEAPTEEPTEAPTEEPTQAPTEKPTEAPTEEPTEAPTEEPTEAPTEEPVTQEPTEAPATEQPATDAPATDEPTVEPTEASTEAPTETPDVTSATDAPDTTTPANGGTSAGSGSTPSQPGGAVQTGASSMAIIMLLVLVSATAGIYFTRKRVK